MWLGMIKGGDITYKSLEQAIRLGNILYKNKSKQKVKIIFTAPHNKQQLHTALQVITMVHPNFTLNQNQLRDIEANDRPLKKL